MKNMRNIGNLSYIDQGVDDMTVLVELSDESLLGNLRSRYEQKLIYTYIGSILISINPYTELGIYEDRHIKAYKGRGLAEMPPHIFGIAETTFNKLMQENESQVIVISGESGAGKTEAFKRITKYLAHSSGGSQTLSANSDSVAKKVLDSTPLLESFGNAKTIRNDNSSRFGKYVEVFFDGGKICGSRITSYLLEKSRIVKVNPDERGYHIFYEVLSGLDAYGKSQYYLKDVKDYKYLSRSNTYKVSGKNDSANLSDLMQQWNTLGLSNDDMDVTMRIISAVLHLGNIEFLEDDDQACYLKEMENLKIVSKLLKVDMESLKNCLTMKTTSAGNESTMSPITQEQAENYRDTLAKHLYSEMFNWIIEKVNDALNKNSVSIHRSPSHLDRSLNSSTSKFRSIAMLDIYGFENFPENSLEQLCINFANETLQQFFNKYVFELEQNEYKSEGISWHYITYPDNQPIIDLLSSKPSGIIQILNDECAIPQGSEEAFVTKSYNVHKKNPHFEKPNKQHPPQFIIHHFAGNINYIATGFLEKNRDILRKEMMNLIEQCQLEEVSYMFRKKLERLNKNPANKARTPAVMADFQSSLTLLLSRMKASQPWFIRCLKPNNDKQSMTFNNMIVMDQMKYTGILETVKIRKSGFPIRIILTVFLQRFYLLQNSKDKKESRSDPKAVCFRLMKRFGGQQGEHFETGRTKLFLREKFARHLEGQVKKIQDRSAAIIQKKWRAYWKIRIIEKQNEAATKLQAIVKGFIARRRIKRLHQAIIKLQAYVRMFVVRKKFIEENPQFLKYIHIKEDDGPPSKSVVNYKFPKIISKTPVKQKSILRYENLKIPLELAYLIDQSKDNYGEDHNFNTESQIVQIGCAQHLWNRDDYALPEDIDYYPLSYFLDEEGNQNPLEPKVNPISQPFLKSSLNDDLKEQSLNAHKLLLRLLHVQSMPWKYHYLCGSYLAHMAKSSVALQKEIIIQLLAETCQKSKSNDQFSLPSKRDKRRFKVAWTMLGNILSYLVPDKDIFNYVLKHISDCHGNDQAVTCQQKLLHIISCQMMPSPRIFPASNLEWRGNSRGHKTALRINHYDNVGNIVHVGSFSKAEDIASQSLCFRMNRFKLLKGWSISIIYQKFVVDLSGDDYVFDVISGYELPSIWSQISGKNIEKHFLVSRHTNSGPAATYIPRSNQISHPQRIKPSSRPKTPTSMAGSQKSIDRWVDNIFSNLPDDTLPSTSSFAGVIHGLEDDLPPNKINTRRPATHGKGMAPSLPQIDSYQDGSGSTYYQAPHTLYGQYNLQTQALEDQLTAVQLEKQILQSSIEKELLRNRYQQITGGYSQTTPVVVPPSTTYYQSQPPQQVPQSFYYTTQPAQVPQQQQQQQQFPIQQQYEDPNKMSLPRPIKQRAPTIPPPPSTTNGGTSDGSDIDSQSKDSREATIERRKSVIKYSKVGPPSNEVVDDTNILPAVDYNVKENISYQRAAEIPKVNIANRTAFLEKFFKDKEAEKMAVQHATTMNQRVPPRNLNPPGPPPPPPSETITNGNHPKPKPPSVSINQSISFQEMEQTNDDEENDDSKPPITPRQKKSFLLPRPSVHNKQIDLSLIKQPETNTDDHLDSSLTKHILSPTKYHTKPPTESKASVLSGIPDIRYFTYNNEVPWQSMLRKEIYLGRDIQESTMLNTTVFLQIVSDLIKIPCSRWIGNERDRLISLLGEYGTNFDIEKLKEAPKTLIVKVIDEAQKCQLYFSRFYPIDLKETVVPEHIQIWISISHSGIRIVEQDLNNSRAQLKVCQHIHYKEISRINCKNSHETGLPEKMNISTRDSNIKFTSNNIQSIYNLINEFKEQQEGQTIRSKSNLDLNIQNGGGNQTNRKMKYNRKKSQDTSQSGVGNETIIYGAGMERIAFPRNPNTSSNKDQLFHFDTVSMASSKKKTGPSSSNSIIEFMMLYSKYQDKKEIGHNVLVCKTPLKSSLMANLNQVQQQNALNINSILLTMCQPNPNYLDCANFILKILYDDPDLIEEAILQILKQLNGNENKISSKAIWCLLKAIILYIGPTKRIAPYLHKQLRHWSLNSTIPYHQLIVDTEEYLSSVLQYGPRKYKPIENEIDGIMKGIRKGSYTFYGMKKSLDNNVQFNTTIHDIIVDICGSFGVSLATEVNEFSLALRYTIANKELSKYLHPENYFHDILNILVTQNASDAMFYFSRTSWMCPMVLSEYERTDTYIEFMFRQLIKDCHLGRHMLVNTNNTKLRQNKIAILIDAIYYILFGDETIANEINNRGITQEILNKNIKDQILLILQKEDINIIDSLNAKRNSEQELPCIYYKKLFLETLEKNFTNFGQIEFPITLMKNHQLINSNNTSSVVFARYEILIFENSVLLKQIRINDLIKFSIDKINKQNYFNLITKQSGSLCFMTPNIDEVDYLLKHYINFQKVAEKIRSR